MMEGIESIVVGDVHVGVVFEEQRQDVIPLLADGIMEGSVTFRVLMVVRQCGNS